MTIAIQHVLHPSRSILDTMHYLIIIPFFSEIEGAGDRGSCYRGLPLSGSQKQNLKCANFAPQQDLKSALKTDMRIYKYIIKS